VLGGEQIGGYWTPRKPFEDGDGDAEWDVAEADPDEAFEVWRAECANSREAVAAAASLGVTGAHVGGDGEKELFSLRWILAHMIEEYARHNGHADLIRERIDGETGE
jgi:hypothetical protein